MTAREAASCSRCHTELEAGDLRCAICGLPAPVPGAARTGEDAPRARILRCTECGAAMAFSAEAGAPRCAFCGAITAIEQPIDPVEEARVRIPFAVDRAQATAALRAWLGDRGFFAPRGLRDEAVLESLTPLYWASWIVNARATVAWTADSDAGARRSAWAPHAGQTAMELDGIVVPASRGLDLEECRLLAPYYDLGAAVPVRADDPDQPDHPDEPVAVIERFDAQRSAAREIVQRAIEASAKTRIEAHIPGRRYRNVHVAPLLEAQTTERVVLPAWVLAYRYRDRAYRAIVHGQRPEVVFGASPRDWTKIALVTLGAVAVLLAVIALIAYATR